MKLRLAAVLYLAVTLLLAWPLAFNLSGSAMPGDPDTDLFMWTLAWNTHALTSAPLSIFDANIYYPHERTLAFSENLLGSTIFAAPVLWTTGDPLLALNIVALSSIVLSGIGAFVLARRLGMTPAAAVLCGMFFAFSPARFFRLGQIHLTTIQWIPFCLAFLHAYLQAGRPRDLRLAIGFFTLQALTSGHGAVFLTTAVICLVGYRVLLGEPLAPLRRMKDAGVAGALLAAPLVLIFMPYRYVQNEFGLRRTLDGWETPVSSFFASHTPVHGRIFDLLDVSFSQEPSAVLFPGLLIIALACAAVFPLRNRLTLSRGAPPGLWTVLAVTTSVVALLAAGVAVYVQTQGPFRLRAGGMVLLSARDPLRPWVVAAAAAALRVALARRAPFGVRSRVERWRAAWRRLGDSQRGNMTAFYALLSIVTILLSAGPPLGLWPLVYDLPGFNFLRVPSRFMLLAVLGLAVLAGFGFERLTKRLTSRTRAIAAAAAALVIVAECFTVPLPGHREYDVVIPAADRWLATLPESVVVAELPTDHHNERRQSTYMLHSMAHWRKTIHGHSGIRTELHRTMYEKLRGFPSEASVDALASAGVTHVVVHPRMYDAEDWRRASAGLPGFGDRLLQVYDDGESRVYALRGSQPE